MRRGPPEVEVVFEDNHVLVVNKPAGLLSQRDDTGDDSLVEVMSAWLKAEFHKPGNVYLGLVHRLDRPVSGLMVLARTSKAASRLSESIRTRDFDKRYRALVSGPALLGPRRVESVVDGKAAALSVTPVGPWGRFGLVEVDLETGRKHQIRLQLAEIGLPIVGDVRHGGPKWGDPRSIALQSFSLAFPHPTQPGRVEQRLEIPSFWASVQS